MPLYEYECKSCGNVHEVIQRFSDEPLKTCKECGGALERLISPPAFHFKGSGWYVTDYGPKSNGKDSEPKAAKDSTEKAKDKAPDKPAEAKPSTTKQPETSKK